MVRSVGGFTGRFNCHLVTSIEQCELLEKAPVAAPKTEQLSLTPTTATSEIANLSGFYGTWDTCYAQ